MCLRQGTHWDSAARMLNPGHYQGGVLSIGWRLVACLCLHVYALVSAPLVQKAVRWPVQWSWGSNPFT